MSLSCGYVGISECSIYEPSIVDLREREIELGNRCFEEINFIFENIERENLLNQEITRMMNGMFYVKSLLLAFGEDVDVAKMREGILDEIRNREIYKEENERRLGFCKKLYFGFKTKEELRNYY